VPKKSICEECGSRVRFAEGVRLEGPGRAVRLLCNKCFNQFKAKAMDLDFEHPAFSPVAMEDCEGVRHRFEIRTMLMGELVTLRAVEEPENGAVGYEIEVLGNPEDDPMELATVLRVLIGDQPELKTKAEAIAAEMLSSPSPVVFCP